MAKQVIDLHVGKGITAAQSNEHLRKWTEKKGWTRAVSTGNYDPTRERLNFEITKGGRVSPVDKSRSIPDRMATILRERGIRDPNEGLAEPKFRTVVNFIFGGSRERMQQLAFGNQAVDFEYGAANSSIQRMPEIEQWAQDVYAFVSDRYGEENIAAFVVHLDELNPHIHCTLLPIRDGRFAYKQIFAGKDKYEFSAHMRQLHNDFAELRQQVVSLERELQIVQEKLADKQEKLQTADRQLEALRQEMSATEEQTKHLQQQAHTAAKDV